MDWGRDAGLGIKWAIINRRPMKDRVEICEITSISKAYAPYMYTEYQELIKNRE